MFVSLALIQAALKQHELFFFVCLHPQVCVNPDDLDVIQHDLTKLIQWMQHLTLRSKGVHAVSVIHLQTLLFLLFK